jgi:hypothetical protein
VTKRHEPLPTELVVARAQKRIYQCAEELEAIANFLKGARDADLADRALMSDYVLMCRCELARIERRLGLRKAFVRPRQIKREHAA